MTTPAIYQRITPARIPSVYFSWLGTISRGLPTDADGNILRDEQGQPVERWAAVLTALPIAVCPPSAQDVERFAQEGQTLSHTVYIRADPTTLVLPDVRIRDRILFPSDGSRYLLVLTSVDVGEAGMLRELHCSELAAYPE